jgi:hypothetical protein
LEVRDEEMRFVTSAVKRNTSADEREEKTVEGLLHFGGIIGHFLENLAQESLSLPMFDVEDGLEDGALLRR